MAQPQMATLTELSTTWSLDDLSKANSLLDMRAAVERARRPKGGDS